MADFRLWVVDQLVEHLDRQDLDYKGFVTLSVLGVIDDLLESAWNLGKFW